MKLKAHDVQRKGDSVTVLARWQDRMRKPANVSLSLGLGEQPLGGAGPVVKGDVAEVTGALFGLAEIAWSMGWRPRGLIGTVAKTVENFKILPEHL